MLVYELIDLLKKCDKSADVFLNVNDWTRTCKNITVTKSIILTSTAKNKISLEG